MPPLSQWQNVRIDTKRNFSALIFWRSKPAWRAIGLWNTLSTLNSRDISRKRGVNVPSIQLFQGFGPSTIFDAREQDKQRFDNYVVYGSL